MIDSKGMTDEEARKHAQKVYALIKQTPHLKMLQDLVKKEADQNGPNKGALIQFLKILWDFIGVHFDDFSKLK